MTSGVFVRWYAFRYACTRQMKTIKIDDLKQIISIFLADFSVVLLLFSFPFELFSFKKRYTTKDIDVNIDWTSATN